MRITETTPKIFMGYVFSLLMGICLTACTEQIDEAKVTQVVPSLPISTITVLKQAALAMPDSYSADAAKDILQKGGNAVDAAIAAQFVLAVTLPEAGNIGGGGFMVYRKNNGEIGALDYREKAPLAASKDMYLDADKNVIKGKSTLGSMAVGIPGTVAGVFETHRKFGSLPMKDILQPVIALAKRGVIVTKKQATRIKSYQARFLSVNKDSILFDKNWQENDTIKYNALAATLTRIQKNGSDEFTKVKRQKN